MKTRPVAFLFLLLVFAAAGVRAGTPLPVHFSTSVTPSPARLGEVVTVTVKAKVDPGWHIYSVVPAATGPANTEIVSLSGGTAAGQTTEDTPIQKFDPNFHTQVAYHEAAATFQRQFRLTGAAGTSVTLHYQTCNDRLCLPPTDVVLPVALQSAAGAARPEYASPLPNAAALSPAAPSSPQGAVAGQGTESAASGAPSRQKPGGLAFFLLAALGAGLLALITPCVFPSSLSR